MKKTLSLKNDFKEIKTDELEIIIGGSGTLSTFFRLFNRSFTQALGK
ncbi:ComC/BlpC family leader-containing pheromone/bacteriocin [Streptococcus mutans]|nr:ComC/BlpC family leader-containing pheromone/bacteriocin [Streptococcus mutans]